MNNNNNNNNMNNITTPKFDNLFLHSLMGRLQLHHNHQQQPQSLNHHSLSKSFEDLLEAATSNNGDFSFSDYDNDNDDDDDDEEVDFNDFNGDFFKTHLSKEEAKLEKELIKVIMSGKIESLKPNSGQAVSIGEHHVCVGFHEENGSDYRVWEWHGHIMLFDEENGYTPEYIYGNYFERLVGGKARRERERKEKEVAAVAAAEAKQEEEEQKVENLGLRELIDGGDAGGSRILHQSRNAGSPRCLKGTGGN